MPKRILSGKVVKKSGDKTVSVLVTRQTTHPIYKKIMRVSKNILHMTQTMQSQLVIMLKFKKLVQFLKVNRGKL